MAELDGARVKIPSVKKSMKGLGRQQQHGASLLLINVAQHAPDDDDDAADGNEE